MGYYYSNGMAAVAGFSEAYSAGSDEAFGECEGAIAARLHNAQEGEIAAQEAADEREAV